MITTSNNIGDGFPIVSRILIFDVKDSYEYLFTVECVMHYNNQMTQPTFFFLREIYHFQPLDYGD